jgi:hypothetical protein
MGVRLDAAGHDYLAGNVNDAARLGLSASLADQHNLLACNRHVPVADAAGSHDLTATDYQIVHRSPSGHRAISYKGRLRLELMDVRG